MTKKTISVLASVGVLAGVTLGIFLSYSTTGMRVQRKVKSIIAEYKPHNEFVPTPAVSVSGTFELPTRAPTMQAPTSATSKKVALSPTPTFPPLPESVKLANVRHEYQTWNNCGPATTAMLLSAYGDNRRQAELAPLLKPDPEDKNVSTDEVMALIKDTTSFDALTGVNGNALLIKRLLARNVPVMTHSWFEYHIGDEMGHFELVVGYDDVKQNFIVHDSFRGPNILVSYDRFDKDWQVYDREFIVILPKEKDAVVEQVLEPYRDTEAMLQGSIDTAHEEIRANENDKYAYFNLGSTLSKLGNHAEAVKAFDKARSLQLPWRMLWYQFAIFESYLAVGRTADVIELTTTNLKQTNNLEESYYYRGRAYALDGNTEQARKDFEKAVSYNPRFKPASDERDKLK